MLHKLLQKTAVITELLCIVVFDLRKQHRLSFVSYLFVPVYFSFVFPGRNFFLKLAVFR